MAEGDGGVVVESAGDPTLSASEGRRMSDRGVPGPGRTLEHSVGKARGAGSAYGGRNNPICWDGWVGLGKMTRGRARGSPPPTTPSEIRDRFICQRRGLQGRVPGVNIDNRRPGAVRPWRACHGQHRVSAGPLRVGVAPMANALATVVWTRSSGPERRGRWPRLKYARPEAFVGLRERIGRAFGRRRRVADRATSTVSAQDRTSSAASATLAACEGLDTRAPRRSTSPGRALDSRWPRRTGACRPDWRLGPDGPSSDEEPRTLSARGAAKKDG
jgi:hypothetical protein